MYRPTSHGRRPLTLTLMAVSRQSDAVRPPPSRQPGDDAGEQREEREDGGFRAQPGPGPVAGDEDAGVVPDDVTGAGAEQQGRAGEEDGVRERDPAGVAGGSGEGGVDGDPAEQDGPGPPAGFGERGTKAEEGGIADDADERDQQRLASQGAADVVHSCHCALVAGRDGRERPDAAGGDAAWGVPWSGSLPAQFVGRAEYSPPRRWPGWRWPGWKPCPSVVAVAVVPSTLATTVTFVSPCFTLPVFWVESLSVYVCL